MSRLTERLNVLRRVIDGAFEIVEPEAARAAAERALFEELVECVRNLEVRVRALEGEIHAPLYGLAEHGAAIAGDGESVDLHPGAP